MKTGLILLLISAICARADTTVSDLEAWLGRVITNLTYKPPTYSEFSQARELFTHTLNGDQTTAELKLAWKNLGFEFSELAVDGKTLWLVSEPDGRECGRGWYLFRANPKSSIALEAPHARNDIHTGLIVLRLFLAGQSRALAVSTITRHKADMAHLDDTFFHAFTLAFAEVCPSGLVVQIHGFESEKHNDDKTDVIASAGTRSPDSWLGECVRQLRKTTSLNVLAYPEDIKQLGALTNAQAKALGKNGHCRFLHLEMTKELRDSLVRSQKLHHAILDSLSTAQK